MVRAGWAIVVLGVLLAFVPVTSDGGDRFDCGPAATAVFGLTEPPEGLVEVDAAEPGEQLTVSRAITCRRAAAELLLWSAGLVVLGGIVVADGRRPRTAEPAETSEPAAIPSG